MALDKLMVISLILFVLASAFVVISLAMPNWIVSSDNGELRVGLLTSCMTLKDETAEVCFRHEPLNSTWLIVFSLISCSIVGLCVTICLLGLSHRKVELAELARWCGFGTMLILSVAAVLFPLGFSSDQIGGELYNLPQAYQVGLSYIFFFVALWMTVLAELFMGKNCIPRF